MQHFFKVNFGKSVCKSSIFTGLAPNLIWSIPSQGSVQNRYAGNFEILIFSDFTSLNASKKLRKMAKMPIFQLLRPKSRAKNAKKKNSRITFLKMPIGMLHTKFEPNWMKTANLYKLSVENLKGLIFGENGYFLPKKA